MDAPAMFTRKQVPEDVGLRNVSAEDDGGQQQLHRDEKQHKPVLKKVKDKVKKIKKTITRHGHGNGNGNGDGDDHNHEHDSERDSNNSDEDEEDAAQRQAEVGKGGYLEDVEDKPILTESDPEVHGAPVYDSEKMPGAKEVKGNDAPAVRLGDLGGPVVEDPAAPQSTTPAPRGGEDIGTTDVVRDFEKMTVRDDPSQVGVVDERTSGMPASDGTVEEFKDPAAPWLTTPAPHVEEDIGNTDVARDFEKMNMSDHPSQVGVGKVNVVDELTSVMPVSDGTAEEEFKDAPTDTLTDDSSGRTYTDRIKNTATGTTELGKNLASTVYDKVAGVGTVVASKAQQITPGFSAGGSAQDDSGAAATPESMAAGTEKMDVDETRAGMPVSHTGTEGLKEATMDATTEGAPGGTYTGKIKSTAASTTEYGKQLASTVYEKVAGVGTVLASKAQQVTPGFGAGGSAQDDSGAAATPESTASGAGTMDVDETRAGSPVSHTGTEGLKEAATDATTDGAAGGTYTDKIKSTAAGTTEYGKQLATTLYEKVAGVGTAVTGKAQQATPSADAGTSGIGAKEADDLIAMATPGAGGPGNGQDKGVTGVTAYIAEMLRPGDEERSLSEAITGAVQQRKEGVGSTVSKAREAPAQAATRAREVVTSLTGGNRVSETVQATTEGNFNEGVAMEGPELHGEKVGATGTNTNVM